MPQLSQEQLSSIISLYNNAQFKEAVDAIKELNKTYPNVPILFNILGACYKSLGEIDLALKMFESATKIKPDYAEAYFNQGVLLRDCEMLDLAIERYKLAISYLPNYPDAHNNLGNIYKDLEMKKEAIECFEWAIAYSPNNALFCLNLGILYSTFDQESALKNYQKAIKIKPDFYQAYFNMGSVLRHLGRKDESISSYEKAIEINPNYIDAHKNLSAMKKYKKNDSQISQMKTLLSNENLSLKDRIDLNFAMARVNEDLECFDEFFKFLNEGNKLRKKELNYSPKLDLER